MLRNSVTLEPKPEATDSIKDVLLPPEVTRERANFKYASEADLLNVALFGQTARTQMQSLLDNAAMKQLRELPGADDLPQLLE